MGKKFLVIVLSICFICNFQVNGARQSPIISGYYITGGEAWSPNSQMLIVPYIPTTHLIYKEKGIWKQKELINGRSGKNYIWSNKGDQYIFWNNGKLYLASLTRKPIVINNADEIIPVWSPDDRYVAYVYNEIILITDIVSMKTKKVTQNSIEGTSDLQWIHNGDGIIFTGINENFQKQKYTIWEVNIKAGEAKIINDQYNCDYIATVRNNNILFLDNSTNDFYLMDLDGKVTRLTNDGVSSKHFIYYGENSVFYTNNCTFYRFISDNELEILLKDIDYVSMAPDRNTIAYSVGDKFYIVDNFIKHLTGCL